jgi:hypothetical protein
MPTITRSELLDILDKGLSLAESQELAFDVGLDWNNLEGSTKRDRLRALLVHHGQRETVNSFLATIAKRRPELGLSNTTIATPHTPPPTTISTTHDHQETVTSPRPVKSTSGTRNSIITILGYIILLFLAIIGFFALLGLSQTSDDYIIGFNVLLIIIDIFLMYKIWIFLRRS